MRRARLLVALTLAVLWLPVTMHCALEVLLPLSFLACCSHQDAAPHEDDDCQTDACAVVESGFYKLQDYDELVTLSPGADTDAEAFTTFDAPLERPNTPVVAASPPPPNPAVNWQFSSRAAPQPRAPSALL